MQNKNQMMAQKIASLVHREGGRTFYVGGYVRDRVMGKENKDIDIEVHGIRPEVLSGILDCLGKRMEMGASFGVFGLRGYDLDIAMPRKEKAVGRGHKDFAVFVDPFLGTWKAAMRRDFTMNALMEDVETGEVIDHFGGIQDIRDGVIRHVNPDTFVEDPLRVLRAAQFAARFGFTVADETVRLSAAMDLSALAPERVLGELKKALLKAPRPSVFFEELRKMDQLSFWFSEIELLEENADKKNPDAKNWNKQKLDEQKPDEQKRNKQEPDEQKRNEQELDKQKRNEQEPDEQKRNEQEPDEQKRNEQNLDEQELNGQRPDKQKLDEQDLDEQNLNEQEPDGQKLDEQDLDEQDLDEQDLNDQEPDGQNPNKKVPKNGDWIHTMRTLDQAAAYRDRAENPLGFMLAALTHVFAECGDLTTADAFLDRITNEIRLKKYVRNMIELHAFLGDMAAYGAEVYASNQLLDRAADPEGLILFACSNSPDRKGAIFSPEKEQFWEQRLAAFRQTMERPYVMGADLVAAGRKPGAEFSEILAYAHRLRLAGVEKESALQQTLAFAEAHFGENG